MISRSEWHRYPVLTLAPCLLKQKPPLLRSNALYTVSPNWDKFAHNPMVSALPKCTEGYQRIFAIDNQLYLSVSALIVLC